MITCCFCPLRSFAKRGGGGRRGPCFVGQEESIGKNDAEVFKVMGTCQPLSLGRRSEVCRTVRMRACQAHPWSVASAVRGEPGWTVSAWPPHSTAPLQTTGQALEKQTGLWGPWDLHQGPLSSQHLSSLSLWGAAGRRSDQRSGISGHFETTERF